MSRLGRLRPTRAGVVLAVLAALLAGYYAWTATSSGNPYDKVTPWQFKYGDSDYYNLQADAFLDGRLWLDVPVTRELARAKNPYDPKIPGARLPDASLYNDRYYLSWGPAPAVTTFLPPRLVGLRIQENLAISLYCFFGVLLACGALGALVRRLLPDTPRRVLWAGYAALALATAIPWILRRPTVYEVAITGAFFFMMAGLYVLVRETLRPLPPRTSRLALAGTLFGLGVLSRPNTAFVVVGMAGLAYVLRHDGHAPRALTATRRRALGLVVGLPVLAGVIFMVYNAARFSGPLDFGNKWQMAGRDVRNIPFNDVSNIAPALYGYLLAPLRVTLEFPYLHLPPPPQIPIHFKAGFGTEATASVLWAVPLSLLSLVFVVRAAWRRRRARRADAGDAVVARDVSPVARVVGGFLVLAALPLLLAVYGVPGYTERYELDFVPYVVFAAVLGWAGLVGGARTSRRAAWWRRGGLVLAAWSALVGVAIGFTGYYDSLKGADPQTFQDLEDAFGPIPTAVTKVAGRPIIAALRPPGEVVGPPVKYTTIGPGGSNVHLLADQTLGLTIVSPGTRDVQLRFTGRTELPGTFVITRTDVRPTVATSVGSKVAAALPLHLKGGVNHLTLLMHPAGGVPPAMPDGTPPALWLDSLRLA